MKLFGKVLVAASLLTFTVVTANAQTRRIAHRSHSGAKYERYDGVDGNYGLPSHAPRLVRVHLESGRDTLVDEGDTLARPYYLDSLNRKQFKPLQPVKPIKTIADMGNATRKLVL